MTAPLISAVLGVLTIVSGLCFQRSSTDQLFVSGVFGPSIVLSSLVALRFPKATYVGVIAGCVLCAEAMMEPMRGLALLVDMLLGGAVAMLTLYPHSYLWAEAVPETSPF
jgi:hypothetical protein